MAMQHQYRDNQAGDLTIHLHPQLRRRLMSAAAQTNLPLEEYISHILEQVAPPEESVTQEGKGRLNRAAVVALKRYREAIERAHPGQIAEDSVELLRQAREERSRELEQQ